MGRFRDFRGAVLPVNNFENKIRILEFDDIRCPSIFSFAVVECRFARRFFIPAGKPALAHMPAEQNRRVSLKVREYR